MGNLITNLEHSNMERDKHQAILSISKSLRRHNAILCLKELHTLGKIDDQEYADDLKELVKNEGFIIK